MLHGREFQKSRTRTMEMSWKLFIWPLTQEKTGSAFGEHRLEVRPDLVRVPIFHIPINCMLDALPERNSRFPIKEFFGEMITSDSVVWAGRHVRQELERHFNLHMTQNH